MRGDKHPFIVCNTSTDIYANTGRQTYANAHGGGAGLSLVYLPLLRNLADQRIRLRLKSLRLVLSLELWSLLSCTLLVLMIVTLKTLFHLCSDIISPAICRDSLRSFLRGRGLQTVSGVSCSTNVWATAPLSLQHRQVWFIRLGCW